MQVSARSCKATFSILEAVWTILPALVQLDSNLDASKDHFLSAFEVDS